MALVATEEAIAVPTNRSSVGIISTTCHEFDYFYTCATKLSTHIEKLFDFAQEIRKKKKHAGHLVMNTPSPEYLSFWEAVVPFVSGRCPLCRVF